MTAAMSPRQVPEHLLARYQKNAPRYTSYPTAPQFTDRADFGKIRELWAQSNTSSPSDLSLYVHIPFCRARCLYCGCHTSVGSSSESVEAYLGGLVEHLDRALAVIDPRRAVEQLSLGGGTPTYLTGDQMTRLVAALRQRLAFNSDGERAIEVDPRYVDAAYLDLLLDLGFNRMSFGLQDLDPTVQKAVRRELPFERIRGHMEHLRARGLHAVNLDLIYGLPHQTPASFAATVDRVVELGPSRIALFGYAHVPWVSPHQQQLDGLPMPGSSERMEIFGLAFEHLLAAGYRHVGMDHFARPGDELLEALDSCTLSRNFMGYTTRRGLDLVALGASGISSVNGTYAQNEKDIPGYVSGGGLKWVKGFVMSGEDRLRREVILDLFCNFHLDIPAVEQRFGIDFRSHFAQELRDLAPFAEDGLLDIEPGALRVSRLGRFFVRNIAVVFDQYIRSETSPEQRYSKVI